jgi:hypothetical protein
LDIPNDCAQQQHAEQGTKRQFSSPHTSSLAARQQLGYKASIVMEPAMNDHATLTGLAKQMVLAELLDEKTAQPSPAKQAVAGHLPGAEQTG